MPKLLIKPTKILKQSNIVQLKMPIIKIKIKFKYFINLFCFALNTYFFYNYFFIFFEIFEFKKLFIN